MSLRFGFIAPLLALSLTGSCAVKQESVANVGIRTESIEDPSLNNQVFFKVRMPATWHFTGTLFEPGTCVPVPGPVFRATSPDGVSFVEDLPNLTWRWGSGPAAAQGSCLPVSGPMTAEQFLKYLAGVLKVEYVSADPVPTADLLAAQSEMQKGEASVAALYAESKMAPPKDTVELGRALVTYRNGTVAMRGRINVQILCMEYSIAAGTPQEASSVHQCTAHSRYFTAPTHRYAAMLEAWDGPAKITDESELPWRLAWLMRTDNPAPKSLELIDAMASQAMAASTQQAAHGREVSGRMYAQFVAARQRITLASSTTVTADSRAPGTVASDWVDYALDGRIVLDPASGQIVRIATVAGDGSAK